jgi:hypothetical protein
MEIILMKFIRQKTTGKIVHCESPHTDKTLDNAAFTLGVDKTELEVAEENWTEDEWTVAINNQLPYRDRRKTEYPAIGDQLDDLYHAGIFSDDMTSKLKAVKDKYPKEI